MFLHTVFILSFVLQTVILQIVFTCTLYYGNCIYLVHSILANCIHLVLCILVNYIHLLYYVLANCIRASLFFSALGCLIWYYCSRVGPEF